MKLLLIYYFIINVVGIIAMYKDKQKAEKQMWRIKEKKLWTIAWIGGAAGMSLAMRRFRHKTKHLKFAIGLPTLAIVQSIALVILSFL